MKKIILSLALILFIGLDLSAQTKPKPKPAQTTQPDINKLLEDAMKAEGMTKEEIEETKKMMNAGNKLATETGFTGQIPGVTEIPVICSRQTKILNSMAVLASKEQYNVYLNALHQSLMSTVDKKLMKDINASIDQYRNNPEALCNIPAVYLYQKNAAASLYAAVKVAILNPGYLLIQNNLAAILLQTGYPQKAIPILLFLLKERSPSPLLNNLAQSYLSLGDTALARKYFMSCIAKAPEHSEANCGMGYLEASRGDIKKATPFLVTALRNGFSPLAVSIIKKNNIKVNSKDLVKSNAKGPIYFNPEKYRPIDPANSLASRDSIVQERENQSEMIDGWNQKAFQVSEALKPKNDKEEKTIGIAQGREWLNNNVLSAKSAFMIMAMQDEAKEYATETGVALQKALKRHLELSRKLNEIAAASGDQVNCAAEDAAINDYLKESAIAHRLFVNKHKKNLYDYYNRLLFYSYFNYDARTYAEVYHSTVSSFFGTLRKFNEMQPLHYASSRCGNIKAKHRKDSLVFEPFCPFSISVSMIVAKLKFDCKTFEFSGGEAIVTSFEYNLKTGESTFGIGAGLKLEAGVFEPGITEKFIFKFDKDKNLVDVGLEMEGGIEVNIGPVIIDRNIKGSICVESGVQGSYTDMESGHDIDFFPGSD